MTVYGSNISFCVYDKIFRLSLSYLLSIVCFLLGNYPASGVNMPTFRNTLYVPSL